MASLPTLPPGPLDPTAVRGLARRHLLDQLDLSAEARRAAHRELKRVTTWMEGQQSRKQDLYHDDINLACGHTARLLTAMARLQSAQAMSAVALARLDDPGAAREGD